MKVSAFILLLLVGCRTRPTPIYAPLPPPRLPVRAKALVVPMVTNYYHPPVFHWPVTTLPAWRLPAGWQTNSWRLLRSTNMVDWSPVCAWTEGKDCGIYLSPGASGFLRLQTYTPPPKDRNGVDIYEHKP